MKASSKLEWECQIIRSKDGKYFGYSEDDTLEKEWHDDPIKAIVWNLKLDDLSKISCPEHISFEDATLVKIKKTVILEEI